MVITFVLIVIFLGVLAVWEVVEQEEDQEKVDVIRSPQVIGHVGITIHAEPEGTGVEEG